MLPWSRGHLESTLAHATDRSYTGYPIIYSAGIHPGDVITRSSDPTLLQIARNTVWALGELESWNPTNGFVPAIPLVLHGGVGVAALNR